MFSYYWKLKEETMKKDKDKRRKKYMIK